MDMENYRFAMILTRECIVSTANASSPDEQILEHVPFIIVIAIIIVVKCRDIGA